MKSDGNPTHPEFRLKNSPRCSAKAKTTDAPCKAPAVRGWAVCRMHGAGGGAPAGPGNGNWKHGGRTNEVADIRRMGAELARESRAVANQISGGVPLKILVSDGPHPAKSGGIRNAQGEGMGEAILW